MGNNSKLTKYQSLVNSVNSFVNGDLEWIKVLSIAKDIEPYDTNQDYCYPDIQMDCKGNGGRVGKVSWYYCGGCYDGYMGPVSWKSYNNLRENKNFKKLSKTQVDQIYSHIQNIPYPIVWEQTTKDEDKESMHWLDYYAKYEMDFEDYLEAKEWYDSQKK